MISIYTPSNTAPDILETILVQREQLLDRIVDRLARSMTSGDKHHILLVGPRGSGKTFLTCLTEHRLQIRPELKDHMRIAWLAEDEVITSLLDLAMAIADQLACEYPGEFEADYRAAIRGLDPTEAEDVVFKRILDQLGTRNLLLLTENLNYTLHRIGDMGRKRLRAFYQEHQQIATLATS